jgi:hypothetical protein
VGVFTLGAWHHNLWFLGLGVVIPSLTSVFIKSLRDDWRKFEDDERTRDQEYTRFRVANEASLVIATLLRATQPQLVVTTTPWGKNEKGSYTGTAVDVTNGDLNWSINFDCSNQKSWIHVEGEDGKIEWPPTQWIGTFKRLIQKH